MTIVAGLVVIAACVGWVVGFIQGHINADRVRSRKDHPTGIPNPYDPYGR